MSRPVVLVDASTLRSVSGVRGIGRYVRDLLYGFEAIRGEWESEFDLRALDDFSFPKSFSAAPDLVRAADDAFAARGTRRRGLVRARRLIAGHACQALGASLLHLPEPLGTPLFGATPRVVTCHDLIPLRYPKQYLSGPLAVQRRLLRERHRYLGAARVICISRRTAADVTELVGVPSERIDVVDHGIDLSAFTDEAGPGDAAVLAQHDLTAGRYIVYAGHADHRKNAEGLLRTLARVREQHDLSLAWAGQVPGWQLKRVHKWSRELGITEAVKLLGFVPEAHMPVLFRHAVAHVFLSRMEGFGMSVVEAMAVGCPVIVARGSASDEVAGDAGCIVEADDTEAAAAHVVRLLRDDAERARWRAAGLARAAYFERARMARDTLAVYRRVLARAGSLEGQSSPEDGRA